MPLSDAKVRAASGREKGYRLPDRDGLFLFVSPAGRRYWRLRYRYEGKDQTLSLGEYPGLSLEHAREAATSARREIKQGKRPSDPRRRPTEGVMTFEIITRRWHEVQKPLWKPHHAAEVLGQLERDIFPSLGSHAISDITPAQVLAVLAPIASRGAVDTAHRIRQRMSQIFRMGIVLGAVTVDPVAAVGDGMIKMRKGGHRPARLGLEEARAVLLAAESANAHPVTRLALRLLALTAVRPGELRGARWTEFEGLEGKLPIWRIPPERMKMNAEHLVPLSKQAIATIEAVRLKSGQAPLLFPSWKNAHTPLSDSALSALLRRAGLEGKHVPHGWRASFSTILNEMFPPDRAVIDLMLAHAPKDQVEGAYNRAAYMTRRRELSQIWADLLTEGLRMPAELLKLPTRQREGRVINSAEGPDR